MEVKAILLKPTTAASSRPYVAVGVIARNLVTRSHHFFAPEGGGEIVVCCGSLSSPQLLLNSIILPEEYPLSTLFQSLETSDLVQHLQFPSLLLSHPTAGFKNFALPNIGKSLLDHTILPYICFGNWWNSHSSPTPQPSPPNCVHGWIFLNDRGEVYNALEDSSPPKSVGLMIPFIEFS